MAGGEGQLAARDGNGLEECAGSSCKNGEVAIGDIQTEVFFFPSAQVAEYEGSFTNTQRMPVALQGRGSTGDCRSDLWFTYQLGKRLKAMYGGARFPRDVGFSNLTWDYESDDPRERERGEPDAKKILKEINGYYSADPGRHVAGFADEDDGDHVRLVDLLRLSCARTVPSERKEPDKPGSRARS